MSEIQKLTKSPRRTWKSITSVLAVVSLVLTWMLVESKLREIYFERVAAVHASQASQATNLDIPEAPTLLYLVDGDSGVASGSKLTLDGTEPVMRWFQDRPGRLSGSISVSDFIADWEANGFTDVPPNAILQLGSGANSKTHAIELTNPSFASGRLTFDIQADEGDELPTGAFQNWSLFIDSVPTQLCFAIVYFDTLGTSPYVATVTGVGASTFDANVTWTSGILHSSTSSTISASTFSGRIASMMTPTVRTSIQNGSPVLSISGGVKNNFYAGSLCLTGPKSGAAADWEKMAIKATGPAPVGSSFAQGELELFWKSPSTGQVQNAGYNAGTWTMTIDIENMDGGGSGSGSSDTSQEPITPDPSSTTIPGIIESLLK